jgi:hypothetical protein
MSIRVGIEEKVAEAVALSSISATMCRHGGPATLPHIRQGICAQLEESNARIHRASWVPFGLTADHRFIIDIRVEELPHGR